MNEQKVIKLLNKAQYNFEPMNDKFSRYDAFDPDLGVMLEIKCRKKHYDDTLLEKMKYDWNVEFAKENDFSGGNSREAGHCCCLLKDIKNEQDGETK